jgi:lipopolysaccharide transport system permease protein
VTQTPVHSYSAEAARTGVLRAALPVLRYPGRAWRHRGLVWNFFRRELLGRFRGSLLGVFWVLAQPLFLFAVYYVVFGFLFGPRARPGAPPDLVFPFWLFSGFVAFNSFLEGTMRSCTSVVENGNLVKKVAFPCELLVLHPALVAMVVHLVGTIVLLAAGIPLGIVQPDLRLLAWPAVMLVHFATIVGLGLLLANLYVFARDIYHLWGILGQAWLFLSPVFWSRQTLEGAIGPEWAELFTWNPMYPLLLAHRQSLGVGVDPARPEWLIQEPFATNLGVASIWALGLLALGYGLFMSRRQKYADLV